MNCKFSTEKNKGKGEEGGGVGVQEKGTNLQL